MLPAGYVLLSDPSSGGSAATAKATMAVATATLNATGVQTRAQTWPVASTSSYAAAIITIPATGGGGGGSGTSARGMTARSTTAARSTTSALALCSTPALVTTMAARCKAMVGWAVAERNDYGTFGPTIRAASPNIVMAHYNKSAVRNGTDPGNFQEVWYAHTCAGARVPSGSAGLDTMQADGVSSPTYSDSRGFTASTWRIWKAKDMWSDLDVYNAAHAATLNGGYLDSMYTASYKSTTCNPATHTAYTKPNWVNLVRTIADAARTERSTVFLLANGLGGGSVLRGRHEHVDPQLGPARPRRHGTGGGWLRGTTTSTASGRRSTSGKSA